MVPSRDIYYGQGKQEIYTKPWFGNTKGRGQVVNLHEKGKNYIKILRNGFTHEVD